MDTENVVVLGNSNFETEVINSSIPVLVDFWAAWCGPCRMISPIVSQLADEFKGKVTVGKVNVDDEREIAASYKVMSIPTIIMFKDGKAIDQVIGARPKSDLEKMIKKALGEA